MRHLFKVLTFLFIILMYSLSSNAYSDVSSSSWSSEAINELTNKYGILSGYPNGTFKPKKNITREEEAAMLYQVIKWVESKPNGVSIDDLRKINMLISQYQQELNQVQNEMRAMRQEQEILKNRIDEVDARLDWNVKNRGLVHMVAMGGGKAIVGTGKDIATLGKGTVWLFTLGKVNLFERTNTPPPPLDRTNRYNGRIQFLNGSGL